MAQQNTPLRRGVRFGPLRGLSQTTRFDLEVHVIDTGDALMVDFVYSSDLFEAATMQRLLSRYERTLEADRRLLNRRLAERRALRHRLVAMR